MPFKNITIEDYDKHYNGDLVEFYSKMCNQTFDNVSKFYDCQKSITFEKDEIFKGIHRRTILINRQKSDVACCAKQFC